jgi:chaperonin GroEL (HSP60 family)
MVIGEEVYWNDITENRGMETTAYKTGKTPTGIKTTIQQLEYIIRILGKNKGYDSSTLVETLRNRIKTLSVTGRV